MSCIHVDVNAHGMTHSCVFVCVTAVDDHTGAGPDLSSDPVAVLSSGDAASELSIGTFVFLRNARFDAATETTANPRYWVGRITAAGPTGASPPSVRAA